MVLRRSFAGASASRSAIDRNRARSESLISAKSLGAAISADPPEPPADLGQPLFHRVGQLLAAHRALGVRPASLHPALVLAEHRPRLLVGQLAQPPFGLGLGRLAVLAVPASGEHLQLEHRIALADRLVPARAE